MITSPPPEGGAGDSYPIPRKMPCFSFDLIAKLNKHRTNSNLSTHYFISEGILNPVHPLCIWLPTTAFPETT